MIQCCDLVNYRHTRILNQLQRNVVSRPTLSHWRPTDQTEADVSVDRHFWRDKVDCRGLSLDFSRGFQWWLVDNLKWHCAYDVTNFIQHLPIITSAQHHLFLQPTIRLKSGGLTSAQKSCSTCVFINFQLNRISAWKNVGKEYGWMNEEPKRCRSLKVGWFFFYTCTWIYSGPKPLTKTMMKSKAVSVVRYFWLLQFRIKDFIFLGVRVGCVVKSNYISPQVLR